MAGGERLRLFCGLRLPSPVVEALVEWQQLHLAAGRLVPPGNLHITLDLSRKSLERNFSRQAQ